MARRHLKGLARLPGSRHAGNRDRRVQAGFPGLLLCLALLSTAAGEADVPVTQAAEVRHLLGYLAESDCQMVRNGEPHSGAAGARHVQRKYDHFREDIASTEQFIELAATKSLRTGRPYEVHCPGESAVPSAEWLQAELERYRASH